MTDMGSMCGRRMGADSLWNAAGFQACCKRGMSGA